MQKPIVFTLLAIVATACTDAEPVATTVGIAPVQQIQLQDPTAPPTEAVDDSATATAMAVEDADEAALFDSVFDAEPNYSPEVAALMTATAGDVVASTTSLPAPTAATDAGDVAAPADAQRLDLLAAFDQALLKLTFTAKDGGNSMEVLVKNRTSNKLALYVAEGATKFTDTIQIVSPARQNLDVPPDGEVTFTASQATGSGGVVSGSVTIERTSPKQ